MASYLRPRELDEALRALRVAPRVVLAGGTDYYPARVGKPLDDEILDISAIDALLRIEEDEAGWRIPARCTWSALIAAPLPPLFDGLKAASREVGGVQIQNTGTLCGNVCNASPAADGIPNLLALDARVELSRLGAVRELSSATAAPRGRRMNWSPRCACRGHGAPRAARSRNWARGAIW